ncbi:MAG: hypothetical protein N7Q72_05100 [Spiroplasma sp. Tabriz.8]|nr:hypothetical protein [Spiroplasma sp. Tabriz.8]
MYDTSSYYLNNFESKEYVWYLIKYCVCGGCVCVRERERERERDAF